jgi:hypothetical protein
MDHKKTANHDGHLNRRSFLETCSGWRPRSVAAADQAILHREVDSTLALSSQQNIASPAYWEPSAFAQAMN